MAEALSRCSALESNCVISSDEMSFSTKSKNAMNCAICAKCASGLFALTPKSMCFIDEFDKNHKIKVDAK